MSFKKPKFWLPPLTCELCENPPLDLFPDEPLSDPDFPPLDGSSPEEPPGFFDEIGITEDGIPIGDDTYLGGEIKDGGGVVTITIGF